MTTDDSDPEPPDRDRTQTVSDGSVRSAGPTDKSVDLADRAMKGRIAQRMFGANTTPVRIGRYRIERRVGAGGMGVVYEAHDDELERRVAIKLLHPELDERHAVRMRREALALAKMSHPNVVHAYEIGEHAGAMFLVMEFIAGESLSKWQRAHRGEWKAILRKYIEAGRGLAAAHAAGIVHRDFKPSNVVVSEEGPARVLDFGLARSFETMVDPDDKAALMVDDESALDARVTVTGTTMGTPAYMSPEQMLGKPTNAVSDQFSFCVGLYEGLYGERPFVGENATELYESLLFERIRPAPNRSRVPNRVRAVVLRGLRADPEHRYANMEELLRALEGPAPLAHWRPALALGALTMGGAIWMVGAADPPCTDGVDGASESWAERRAEVQAAFVAGAAEYGEAVATSTQDRIDRWTKDWADVYGRACEIDDAASRRSTLACLDQRRMALSALTEVLAMGGAGVVDHAFQLVDELPRAGDCMHVDSVSIDPGDHARLLSARLDAVAGRDKEARATATAVLESARASHSGALEGEALLTLAHLEIWAGSYREAIPLLRDAAAAGLTADAPLLVADAWIELARLLAADLASLDASHEHSTNARALLERYAQSHGSVPGDRGPRLAAVEGAQAGKREDMAVAEAKLREAVAGLEAAHDPQHKLVIDARLKLADAIAAQGKTDEALALYTEGREAMAELAGERHPRLHGFDYGIALVHMDLGEIDNARVRLESARDLLADRGSAWAHERGRVLVALAQAYGTSGREKDALQAAREAKSEVTGLLSPADITRRNIDAILAQVLQNRGDLDGAAEALRSLAAGNEAADDRRTAAEVRAHLVGLELRRGRPEDAGAVLERHREAIAERFGEAKVRVLEEAVSSLQQLQAGDTAAGRAGLERVREALGPDEVDFVRWCDLRAWATLALARSLADDDPERATTLSAQARQHLVDTEHDPGLLAEID